MTSGGRITMIEYKLTSHIATISDRGYETIELTRGSWKNNPEKIDIRKWRDGTPGKGISLTEDEAEELLFALGEELGYDMDLLLIDDGTSGSDTQTNTEGGEEPDWSEEPDEFPIDYRTFFIHTDYFEEEHPGHEYYDVIACCDVLVGNEVRQEEFPAKYCIECNLYLIDEDTYRKLKRKGKLLCQLATPEEYIEYKKNLQFGELSPESPLHLLGYTVNASDGLSGGQRHSILEHAMQAGVLKKSEIKMYLEYFIRLNEGRPNMRKAVQKWREDLNYIMGTDDVAGTEIRMGVARIVSD